MSVSTDAVKVSLTKFVDFATKPGEQQLTVVRQVRQQHATPYEPKPDIYKQFREAVRRLHRTSAQKSYLDGVAKRQTEPSRVKHYPPLVAGYQKFLGRKQVQWFDPPATVWACEDLQVNVKPELGLVIDGERTLVKLWLKDGDGLNKKRAELIVHLMGEAYDQLTDETRMCVLDVRKGRPYYAGTQPVNNAVLLTAQARSFVSMYRDLGAN